jgi:hypothetical protein
MTSQSDVWDCTIERRAIPRDAVSNQVFHQTVRAIHRRMDEQIDSHHDHAVAIADMRGDIKRLAFAVLSLRDGRE